MSNEYVEVTKDSGIATIRLNRPKMNALNGEIQDALGDAANDLADDADVRAVVITGGEKVFAAGADIKEMAELDYVSMLERGTKLQKAFAALAELPVPTIAAIEGYALGGGCELALTCDFRIASTNATLGQPEILLGIIPGGGGTQRLTRLVGAQKAKDLIFSGRFVPAGEALNMGLVDELVEPGTTYEAALSKARTYVNGPRVALAAAKEAIGRGIELELEAGLRLETHLFAGLFATADQRIGMTSFIENGPGKAQFEGR